MMPMRMNCLGGIIIVHDPNFNTHWGFRNRYSIESTPLYYGRARRRAPATPAQDLIGIS